METEPEQFEHRKDCQGAAIDTVCLGCLLSERDIGDEAIELLRRIVSYYDDPRCGNDWHGLPGMDIQAKARHESTMFGAARALIDKVPNAEWTPI